MCWNTLIASLIKTPTIDDIRNSERGEALLKQVADAAPAIYWYPGSGYDLNLLALDPPNNPTGRRIFPLQGEKADAQPLLLWMNDCSDSYWAFPAGETERVYDRFSARRKLEGSPCRYIIPTSLYDARGRRIAIPLTVFQVRVTGGKPKRFARPKEGDLYTVFFSAAESDMLLSCVLAPHRLRVEVVALIHEGWARQRPDFTLYQDVPRRLGQYKAAVGEVQYFLVDQEVEIPGYRPQGMEIHGIRMWVPR